MGQEVKADGLKVLYLKDKMKDRILLPSQPIGKNPLQLLDAFSVFPAFQESRKDTALIQGDITSLRHEGQGGNTPTIGEDFTGLLRSIHHPLPTLEDFGTYIGRNRVMDKTKREIMEVKPHMTERTKLSSEFGKDNEGMTLLLRRPGQVSEFGRQIGLHVGIFHRRHLGRIV